jgi:hypothetical protein
MDTPHHTFVRIQPELIEELCPTDVHIPEEVRERLLRLLTREMQIVYELLKSLKPDEKITASDVRMVLSLRGFNLCL